MKLKLHTFQIGSPRKRGEGLRIGTVRFLPRGVYKKDYAKLDYFDVWFPILAPSKKLITWARSQEDTGIKFREKYEREMLNNTNSRQAIKLLARLAIKSPIAIGCYCEDEKYCHRSVLRKLIKEEASKKNGA
jgi:uncharacterized protein YeaO (DUF488 family)